MVKQTKSQMRMCVCGVHDTPFPIGEACTENDVLAGRDLTCYISDLVKWNCPLSVEQCIATKDILISSNAQIAEKLKSTVPVMVDKEASLKLRETKFYDNSLGNEFKVSSEFLQDKCKFVGQLLYHDFCTEDKLELIVRSVLTQEQALLVN